MESKRSYFFVRFNTKFCLTIIRIIAVSIDELHLILSLFLPFYKEGGIFKGGLNSLKNCLNAETP